MAAVAGRLLGDRPGRQVMAKETLNRDPARQIAELGERILSPVRPAREGDGLQKRTFSWIFILSIAVVCAWSPWLTEVSAYELAETQFNEAWSGIIDGCGTSGADLGARDFRKIPFGAYVTLDYQCGLVMPGEPALQTRVYVSFVGIAFGYPRP